jgi:hypothetical protein
VARAHASVANSLSARATPHCSWGSLVSRHRPVLIAPSMHACTLRRPRPPLLGHGRPVRVVRMLTAHWGSTLLTHHVASNVDAPLFSTLPFSSFTSKPPPPTSSSSHIVVVPALFYPSSLSTTLARVPRHLVVPSPSPFSPPLAAGPHRHSLRPPASAATSERRRATTSTPPSLSTQLSGEPLHPPPCPASPPGFPLLEGKTLLDASRHRPKPWAESQLTTVWLGFLFLFDLNFQNIHMVLKIHKNEIKLRKI